MFARASLPYGFERVAVLGKRVVFSRVDDLPEDAATEKAVLRRFGPKSNVTLPLRIGDDIFGALCFGSMSKERAWSPELLDRLGSVANLVAGVLARRRTDGELRAALEEIGRLRERLEQENAYLRQEVRQAGGSGRIVGQSAPLRRVLGLVERVAPTDAPVLITGETGVGKELVADAIHSRSPRAGHTMVKLNCAALPATLVEAELFGREKGAYTGALTRQIGRFELADRGTLLLDEVSELPLDLQAKLLRVLQEGRFERLGSSQTIQTDVRIIAATNRDLERAVADGRFRADLYFRLAVFPIAVPPLRERPQDVAPLVRALVDEVGRKMGKRIADIAPDSLAHLERYAWPGNVRELRNVVERAIILSDGPTLHVDPPERRSMAADASLALEDVERRHIEQILEQTGWRVRGAGGAAALLGLPPTTLETRMAKLGIRRPT
jgi:transcriptional regulator with GAF, ATPase, and Fis domain